MFNVNERSFITRPFGIIGHRGAAGHAVENSLEAFEIAFGCKIDAIELDVQFVNDELIVFHDDTIDRLTIRSGKLAELSPDELSNLRLRNGEPVPTLNELWERVPPSIGINIELKGPETGKPVAEFVREHSHRYLISSFYVDEIKIFRQLAPEIPTALLNRVKSDKVVATAIELGVDNIHVMDAVAEPDYLQPMLDANFNVYIFTVNSEARAKELRALGVTAIFTDVPRQLNRESITAS